MTCVELSILDQAPVSELQTGAEAARNAVKLAQEGEKLGYKRMWMAEHHNTPLFGSPSPELIISHIAARTEKIRVGTGGIMLMHYSPYKIAENIKTLSALAPGRIDFGAGRAPGGDHGSTYALSTSKAPDFSDQYEKLDDALKMINEDEENTSDRRFQEVYTAPGGIDLPEAWLLGSSGNSAAVAGEKGIGYSFAQFFARGAMHEDIFQTYRENFQPSDFMKQPRVMVAYLVTVAETEEEAVRRALPHDLSLIGHARGKNFQMPSTEDANEMELSDEVRQAIDKNRDTHLVGTAEQVADKLRSDQEKYGIDEIMICSNQAEFEGRLETYRLLAEELI